MAKLGKTSLVDTRWQPASELHLIHEEAKLKPLDVNKLKLFIPSGLERGSIIEISGAKSSGRTSTSLYILAESISNGETCACIDLHNSLDPFALAHNGANPGQLCWVRCHGNTEHAIRSADLLLHAGGFGVVLLDLCGASLQSLNRIPLSYWFRFQRAVEDTPTILIICSEHPQARACSRHSLTIQSRRFHWLGEAPFALLSGMECSAVPRKVEAKITSIRPEYLMIPSVVV